MKSPITYTLTFVADDGTVEYPEVARLREAVELAKKSASYTPPRIYRKRTIQNPDGSMTVGYSHMWDIINDKPLLMWKRPVAKTQTTRGYLKSIVDYKQAGKYVVLEVSPRDYVKHHESYEACYLRHTKTDWELANRVILCGGRIRQVMKGMGSASEFPPNTVIVRRPRSLAYEDCCL